MSEHQLPISNEWAPESNFNNPLTNVVGLSGVVDRPELSTSVIDQQPTLNQVIVLKSGSDHPFIEVLDRHRAKYVRDERWMPADHLTDFDRYDAPERSTYSYVETTKDAEGEEIIVSSLRLTRVEDMADCMSFDMVNLGGAEELPEAVYDQFTDALSKGSLYDLTRLLPPSAASVSRKEYLAGFSKLIGHAYYRTAIEPDQDPIWIFATTAKMHKALNLLGILSEELKDVPESAENLCHTKLCYLRPVAVHEYVAANKERYPITYKNGIEGIQNARLTPIR